ncbi:MAG: hypothetical protein KU37_05045 [Sulfuricurvum sp. PC08-66]|nr:MAG: hypothetical protein KU37_05045 [Sulfuricurvum sp. PC08-66]
MMRCCMTLLLALMSVVLWWGIDWVRVEQARLQENIVLMRNEMGMFEQLRHDEAIIRPIIATFWSTLPTQTQAQEAILAWQSKATGVEVVDYFGIEEAMVKLPLRLTLFRLDSGTLSALVAPLTLPSTLRIERIQGQNGHFRIDATLYVPFKEAQ